ncbi:MAG: hypothetical protein AB1757_04345 [Acidobacteriota bacterium]
MRKIFSLQMLMVLALTASSVQADTITLKNGSVIKGKVSSFADDQFVILLNTGSSGNRSKAMIYAGDIAKIDFEAATAGDMQPEETMASSNPPPTVKETPKEASTKPAKESQPPVDPSLKNTKNTKKPEVKREPEPKREEVVETPPIEKTPQPEVTTPEIPKVDPKKANVKTQTVEVGAKRDWTSTGLIVKKGDKIRITATGTINIDPAGEASGPEGLDTPDTRKLMADKPTGALIGVIGADNDDFLFIGRAAEFTATRDGLLFLSVNEGTLSDNSGAYKAVIEIQSPTRPTRQ